MERGARSAERAARPAAGSRLPTPASRNAGRGRRQPAAGLWVGARCPARHRAVRITYVGHATLLLEIGGRRVLTDPNFEPTLGRFLPRVSAPGVAVGALPPLDALLVTHAHADHLSFASLDLLPRTIPLLAPPAVATWLRRLGYAHAEPIAPGEERRVGELVVSAAAARHEGSRYGVDRWRGAANM